MQAARAEAILCNMLVEHNLPISCSWITYLAFLVMLFLIAKLQRRSNALGQTVVKHAIAPATNKSMISMVNPSPAFSLLMDVSTDRGVVKREGTLTTSDKSGSQ